MAVIKNTATTLKLRKLSHLLLQAGAYPLHVSLVCITSIAPTKRVRMCIFRAFLPWRKPFILISSRFVSTVLSFFNKKSLYLQLLSEYSTLQHKFWWLFISWQPSSNERSMPIETIVRNCRESWYWFNSRGNGRPSSFAASATDCSSMRHVCPDFFASTWELLECV